MMPYGEAVYARNAELGTGKAGYYDVIPSFKSVQHLGGSSVVALDNIVLRANWLNARRDKPRTSPVKRMVCR